MRRPIHRRLRTGFLGVILAASGAATSEGTQYHVEDFGPKDSQVLGVPNPQPQALGDDLATAIPILDIPFADDGNTCSFADDYDEACPHAGSTAPDVVYRFSPDTDRVVTLNLCGSDYDTKLFVYENSLDGLVACNDDGCGSAGFQSELTQVPLTAGNDYYIVIDGYGSDCGAYDVQIQEYDPCTPECPPGGYAEGEPPIGDGYVDHYNGGCDSDPSVFSPLPCSFGGPSPPVCASGGGYSTGGVDYRDTDWYEVDVESNSYGFSWCVSAESPLETGYVAQLPCEEIHGLDASMIVPACETECLEVPPGAWYLFVASVAYGAEVGVQEYVMDTGLICPGLPVEPDTWGRIKGRYR